MPGAKTLIYITTFTVVLLFVHPAFSMAENAQTDTAAAQENTQQEQERRQALPPGRPHLEEELRQIKAWVQSIERDTERRSIFSEEEGKEIKEDVYPLQTSSKTRLSGGMTLITQGVLNNASRFGGDRADGSLSIDLILESEIRDNGLLIVRGDFMRGKGLTRLPPQAAGGVNADIETFTDGPDGFHLIEALYEHSWHEERYRVAFGQIDTTSYFDLNTFANSETFQFISPLFGNNAVIDWGGDANGYGAGFIFHAHSVKTLEFNLGFFEGDGNYTDMFDQPFVIAEFELEYYRDNLEGHYRFMVWSNETNRKTILNSSVTASHNRGIAISFDQALSERYGLWARAGVQDGKVSAFDRHASMGLQVNAPLGRPHAAGIAFGATWLSDENQQANGLDKNEYTAEAYYNIHAAQGIQLSPDVQYIVHPGGDGSVDPITVYGLRAQLIF